MGRKRQKRKKSSVLEYRRLPTEKLYQGIEDQCARGDFRAAIEMGKECYRREPCPKHIELLGELYVHRARELADKNLPVEAFAVLNYALGLGYGSQELLHLAFECGLRGGQYEQAAGMLNRMKEPELRSRAVAFLADEVVVQGDAIDLPCEPRVCEDALRVRRAFAAFESGDDSAATSELKPIGLRSSCSGWKWVLLGLLAYYRDEKTSARSCWTRVRGDGQSARLAGVLLSCLDSGKRSDDDSAARIRDELLGNLDNPRVAVLEKIQQAIAEKNNTKILNHSKRLLSLVRPEEREAYAQRLGRAVVFAFDWESVPWQRFKKVFGEFPEDPLLLRAAAIRFEREIPEEAGEFWKHYLENLRRVKVIPSRLLSRARALVWQQMGDVAYEAEKTKRFTPSFLAFDDLRSSNPIDSVTCYRKSIKSYPDDLQTHEKLLAVLSQQSKDRKEAERQAEEILKRWPTHIDSLLLLGNNCFRRNAFRKALNYFDRAREAEPFNTKINNEMQTCLLYSARRRLDNGNFDLARKDYEQVAALSRSQESTAYVYCKWAALEWRVGNPIEAERLYAHAESGVDGPLVLYYQMVIELRRACAPKKVQDRFDKLLAAEWKGEPTGVQAADVADVAEVAYAYEDIGIRFDGCEKLRRSLCRYLKLACKKVEFSEEHLLSVCRYLVAAKDWGLLEQFARKGLKQFQANYFFPKFLGQAQLRLDKWPLPGKTAQLLNTASQQATQAGEHGVADEIAKILNSGGHFESQSIRGLLKRFVLGSLEDDFEDSDDDPFDDLDDLEDEVPPRRGRSSSGSSKPDRDQMPLFEDIVVPEAEGQ